jgi:chondroitin AC lyase
MIAPALPPETAAALELVRARLAAAFVKSAPGASEVSVEQLLATLDASGHWPDLDEKYDPATAAAGPSRYVHFLRVWKLAGAWADTADPGRRAALAAAVHRALDHRLPRPHPSSIPWFYLIGAPQALARAALIFEPELTDAQRAHIQRILRTCVGEDGVLLYCGEPATGQNLQHEAELLIAAGCLARDPAVVAHHAALIEREIAIRDAEGLKADWSFHQHGPQLYSGGLYGSGFSRDAAKLAWALDGTPFAFSPATLDAIVSYVLEGQQWMSRGRSFDPLTAGRMVAWPGFQGVEPEGEHTLADTAAMLADVATLDAPRRAALRALAARGRGEAEPGSAPAGTRVFWASDYVSHQRPGFFASARMSSRRVYGTESGSGQNEQGYHLGDGAMSLLVTGEEYRDIFPLWDWRRVPGVSAVQNPAAPFPRHTWGKGSQGWSDFAGGVSDGVLGAAAMQLHRGGLHARKAWFFLEEAVVCLGADLLPDDPTLPVFTSLDQRWADGPVLASTTPAPLAPGPLHALDAPAWVHHAGVSYLFPAGGAVRVRREHRSAPWSVINTAVHGNMFRDRPLSQVVVEGEVFELWIDHGKAAHPLAYAYLVAPGLAPENIPAYLAGPAPRILANTAALQAVARDGLVQAVFWRAGELRLPDGRALAADRPGLVQVRRDAATGREVLSVGNPTHRPGPLRVHLGGIEHVFDFPAGLHAGQPLVRALP